VPRVIFGIPESPRNVAARLRASAVLHFIDTLAYPLRIFLGRLSYVILSLGRSGLLEWRGGLPSARVLTVLYSS